MKRSTTYSHGHHGTRFGSPSQAVSSPAAEELNNVKDAMNSVDEYHATMVETLEVGGHNVYIFCYARRIDRVYI